MPGSCAIATCQNYYSKTRRNGIHYHRFPKNEVLRKTWKLRCKRADSFNEMNSAICSEHFPEEDYERDLRNELLGLPIRKMLKDTAVPSLNLPGNFNVNSNSERKNRQEKRKRTDLVGDLINSDNAEEILEDMWSANDENTEIECMKDLKTENEILLKENYILMKENEKLKKQILYLSSSNHSLTLRVKVLKVKQNQMQKELLELRRLRKDEKKDREMCIKNLLSTVFTPGQIRVLLGQKRIVWNSTDIAAAITLRTVSRRAYHYLRNKVNIPLPALSTLRRWVATIKCSPGIQATTLKLMQSQGMQMTEAERTCVISIDEMKVSSKMCYNIETDEVIGPCRYVLVFMARGLVNPWKQPVFYDFDVSGSSLREILMKVICAVENIMFPVFALTSDLGALNQKLWKELAISPESPFFENPFDKNRHINVFADIPHMVKLLRNHILDSGIKIRNIVINCSLFEKLLEKDSKELKIAYNMSETHIRVKGANRQIVRYAVQLLSERVGNAIKYLFPEDDEAANFILLVDRFFDTMNSRQPFSDKPFRCALGNNQQQFQLLNEAYNTFSQMRVVGRKNALPFQQGLLVSITSVMAVHKILSEKYELKYFLTRRVNQDVLEIFFSQIRAAGNTYDHPSPLEFQNRLRLLVLGKVVWNCQKSNVLPESEQHYLTVSMLSSSCVLHNNASCNDETAHTSENEITAALREEPTTAITSSSDSISYQALRYLAGYVAFKCQTTCPGLGDKNAPLDLVQEKGILCDWISVISRGCLQHPTNEWMSMVIQLEEFFLKLHGKNNLRKVKRIVHTAVEASAHQFPPNVHPAIKLFMKTRIMIRMRHINAQQKIYCQPKKRKLVKTVT